MPIDCCAITEALKMNQVYQFENEEQSNAYKLAACQCDCARPTLGGTVQTAQIKSVELVETKLHITVIWCECPSIESCTIVSNSMDSSPETTTENSYTLVTSWPSAPTRLNIDIFSKKEEHYDVCTADSCVPGYLAGSKVILADFSEKHIEEINVGDYVKGAFGEMNQVNAIHTCKAGDRFFTCINNTLVVPINTAFVGADKKLLFRCGKTALDGFGRFEHIMDCTGCTQLKHNYGVESNYIHNLIPNTIIKSSDGSKNIDLIEECRIDPNIVLYSLAVSGSHTHFIDTYAVGGWPNSYDFDYDTWTPK
jgi:hypothetical protein